MQGNEQNEIDGQIERIFENNEINTDLMSNVANNHDNEVKGKILDQVINYFEHHIYGEDHTDFERIYSVLIDEQIEDNQDARRLFTSYVECLARYARTFNERYNIKQKIYLNIDNQHLAKTVLELTSDRANIDVLVHLIIKSGEDISNYANNIANKIENLFEMVELIKNHDLSDDSINTILTAMLTNNRLRDFFLPANKNVYAITKHLDDLCIHFDKMTEIDRSLYIEEIKQNLSECSDKKQSAFINSILGSLQTHYQSTQNQTCKHTLMGVLSQFHIDNAQVNEIANEVLVNHLRQAENSTEFLNYIRFSADTPIETLALLMNNVNKQYQTTLLQKISFDIGHTTKFQELLATLPEENIIELFIQAGEKIDEITNMAYDPQAISCLKCSDSIKSKLHLGHRMYRMLREDPNFADNNFHLLKLSGESLNGARKIDSLASGSFASLQSIISKTNMSISELTRAQIRVLRKLSNVSASLSQRRIDKKGQTIRDHNPIYSSTQELIADLEDAFLSSTGKLKSFVLERREADPKRSQIMIHVAYLVHVLKHSNHSALTATALDTPETITQAELLATNERMSTITPAEVTFTTVARVVEPVSNTPSSMFHHAEATPYAPRESLLERNGDLAPSPDEQPTPSAPRESELISSGDLPPTDSYEHPMPSAPPPRPEELERDAATQRGDIYQRSSEAPTHQVSPQRRQEDDEEHQTPMTPA